jgi:metallo-beta-lactamase class B
MRSLALLALMFAGAAAPAPQTNNWDAAFVGWTKPAKPFHLAGNIYYVGTGGISAFLITDPKGHILIDGALPQSATVIAANIRKLGFKMKDVRYILINHAHFDHAGGLAALKRITGAELLASADDAPDLQAGKTAGRPDLLTFPRVKVDRIIADGEHIRLGAIDLVTQLTPGHTKGCTSWTTKVEEGGRSLDVALVCSITVAGQDLTGGRAYPDAAADFRATFAKLRGLHADIFLSFHPEFFNMDAKRAKQVAGDRFAFVAEGELKRRVDDAETAFDQEFAAQKAEAN